MKYGIFDMDGTLVDSMGVWNRASEEYLISCGVEEPDREILDRAVPMTMPETAGYLIRQFGLDSTPERVMEEINGVMERHYRTDIPLKPGAEAFLKTLQQRGVRMAVASSTSPHLLDICLRRLGVRERFDFLLSCEEVGAGKDFPDVYLEAARRLGGTPEETVVFEDAIFAARTAKGAGFRVAAIRDEASLGSQEQLAAAADWYLPSWEGAADLFLP